MKRQRAPARDGEPHFINIDLDIRSRHALVPLGEAWPWAYHPTGERRWLLVNPRVQAPTAEAAARALLRMIESLRGKARACWQTASRRTFDIGIQAGADGRAFEGVKIRSQTLLRIAAIHATVKVTVYPGAADR